jgi:hypothetical protein
MMSVEQSVEWELAGETEVLGENHFVHHKSNMTRTRAAPVGSRRLTAWAMARPSKLLKSYQYYQHKSYISWEF